jgi:predicted flavoprotein YhiN
MLPLALKRARPIDEAISGGGGVGFDAIAPQFDAERAAFVFVAPLDAGVASSV